MLYLSHYIDLSGSNFCDRERTLRKSPAGLPLPEELFVSCQPGHCLEQAIPVGVILDDELQSRMCT